MSLAYTCLRICIVLMILAGQFATSAVCYQELELECFYMNPTGLQACVSSDSLDFMDLLARMPAASGTAGRLAGHRCGIAIRSTTITIRGIKVKVVSGDACGEPLLAADCVEP